MGLYFSSLNSGSNGNCYYVGNQNEAVLVDVGISCKEVEKRMARQGLSLSKLKAIFISHEHSDHIKGLEVFAKKHRLTVYLSKKTLEKSRLELKNVDVHFIDESKTYPVGDLNIVAFSKIHDAADPYSFVVEGNDYKVGIFTDLGSVCKNLIYHFKQCHAVFLEANYDVDMLSSGNYPHFLKQRIMGGRGHLSNIQALELCNAHKSKNLSHVLLCHLSKQNNDPSLVRRMFSGMCTSITVEVASRSIETIVYCLGGSELALMPEGHNTKQLQLF